MTSVPPQSHSPSEKTRLFFGRKMDHENSAGVSYNSAPIPDPEQGELENNAANMPDPKGNSVDNVGEPVAVEVDRISFSDLGIPRAPSLQEGITGKERKLQDIPVLEKLYAIAMLGAILALVSFTIYRLSRVDDKDPDFVFGLVLIVNAVFCSFYVIDAVKRERPSEIFFLTIATTLMVLYLIVNYTLGERTTVKLARMIVAIVLAIPLVIFGLKTAYEYYVSKSLIFRTVGANSQMQDLLQRLHFFQDALKFDLELGISIIILVLTSRLSVHTRDIVILSVGGVITIGWFIFGYFGFQKELKGSLIFFPLGLPEIGYVIYKLYDVSHYIDSKSGLAGATIACACAAIVMRIVVLIIGYLVYRGFGQGLKEKLK